MRAATSRQIFPLAPRALSLIGLVMVLAVLLDYAVLLIAPELQSIQWQIGIATQLVDRGVVALVGLGLLFAGFWMGTASSRSVMGPLLALRWPGAVLAALFTLLFLLIVPLQANNQIQQRSEQLAEIEQQATDATSQLDQQTQEQIQQQRQQVNLLLQNEQALQQVIAQGQIEPELIQQFEADPANIDSYLQQEGARFKEEIQAQIQTRRDEAEQQVKQAALRSGLRVSLTSLFLTIGFGVLTWSSFIDLLQGSP